jgi:hypothetical protein
VHVEHCREIAAHALAVRERDAAAGHELAGRLLHVRAALAIDEHPKHRALLADQRHVHELEAVRLAHGLDHVEEGGLVEVQGHAERVGGQRAEDRGRSRSSTEGFADGPSIRPHPICPGSSPGSTGSSGGRRLAARPRSAHGSRTDERRPLVPRAIWASKWRLRRVTIVTAATGMSRGAASIAPRRGHSPLGDVMAPFLQPRRGWTRSGVRRARSGSPSLTAGDCALEGPAFFRCGVRVRAGCVGGSSPLPRSLVAEEGPSRTTDFRRVP